MSERDSRRQALKDAARWHVLLSAGDAGPELLAAWQQWLASDSHHQWAWQRVEDLRGRLAGDLGERGELALEVIQRSTSHGRRHLLKGLAGIAGVGLLGLTGYRVAPSQGWLADLRTGVGEIRQFQLADGSQLTLDTDSAVDLLYDTTQRRLRLLRGRLLASTASDPRPFLVETAEGLVQALGTRFSVMQWPGDSQVAVFQHAVEVRPRHGQPLRLDSGQAARFDARRATPEQPETSEAWSQGHLLVDDWPLDRLFEELARYRPGLLHYDPRLAALRVSGTFSLRDTDATLNALQNTFGLQVQRRSRYWVSVSI